MQRVLNRRAASTRGVLLVACTLAVAVGLTVAPAQAVGVSWKAVPSYGTAIMLSRNSHCTAAANMAKYHGLQQPGEPEDRLLTLAYMYVKQCACGERKGKPIHWFICEGLAKMFESRHPTPVSVRERATHSNKPYERATWSNYVAAINAGRPVAVTYCYDPASAAGVEAAKGRYSSAFSVLGIGWMDYGGQKVIIAHDGATSDGEVGAAAPARLEPSAMGINIAGKPWGQAGTTLYKWDAGESNLLLVFCDV